MAAAFTPATLSACTSRSRGGCPRLTCTLRRSSFSPALNTSTESASADVSGACSSFGSSCSFSSGMSSVGNVTSLAVSSPKMAVKVGWVTLSRSCKRAQVSAALFTRVHHSAQEETCSCTANGSRSGP
eukprot:3667673-Amphidinium_carterae.4